MYNIKTETGKLPYVRGAYQNCYYFSSDSVAVITKVTAKCNYWGKLKLLPRVENCTLVLTSSSKSPQSRGISRPCSSSFVCPKILKYLLITIT